MRLRHYLNEAGARLQKAGVDSPRLCAQALAQSVLDPDSCVPARLFCLAQAEKELTREEREALDALMRRRATGQPLAQITGRKEFYGRDFLVTAHTLIPRPETELLIDLALERMPSDQTARFADLGAGSGCIGLTLAAERPAWRGLLLDISPEALRTAAANARTLRLEAQTSLVRGDMFAAPLAADSLDLLVSNPPYIAHTEQHTVMPEVLAFEPHSALFSASDGMAHLALAVRTAACALRRGGLVLLEHGAAQGPRLRCLLEQTGLFAGIATHKDLAGLERCSLAQKKSGV